MVDELLKRGCEVIYESMYEVHVSGHACQEELKIMPGHHKAEIFHPGSMASKSTCVKHAGLADLYGNGPRQNIYIGDIGDVLEINHEYMKKLTVRYPPGVSWWMASA